MKWFKVLPLVAAVFGMGMTAHARVTVNQLGNGASGGVTYQLLKLSDGAGLETFALWIPPRPDVRSAVLISEPYTGIDWTGLELDRSTAALPEARSGSLIEDRFGPLYEAGRSQKISYFYKTPESTAAFALPFTLNGIGALFVFQRFYAGHSIERSALETALGLEFLGTRAEVDPSRIGIFGASWGGFEALHGAARAAPAFKPRYGVAWQPMVDFRRFWDDVTRDYYLRFANNPDSQLLAYIKLEPYARRVAVSAWSPSSGEVDFSRYGIEFLRENLATEFLVLHDEWDTIVPVDHTLDLIGSLARAPMSVAVASRAFVVPRPTPIDYANFTVDHFPVGSAASFDSWGAMQFAYSYLISRLAAPAASYWINLYDGNELAALLMHLKSMKVLGRDVSSVVPGLVDLCREKSWLYNISSPGDGVLPGAVIVSAYVNLVFGLGTTPENVRVTLESGGL